ncbi:MAG: hypothetical protein AMJ65_10235 [Phycisphaerae bacterium SG8_4]|nr:MAG: hypothetical protein AMJ65_10235 [Phycisphaerae bacterium SG8_4]
MITGLVYCLLDGLAVSLSRYRLEITVRKIMKIDDTIEELARIHRAINQGIPKNIAGPDALVNHLNDLCGESTDGLGSEELLTCDDVGSPSITLAVHIDVEFDPRAVMESMQTRLRTKPQEEADEIGKTGAVWSCGRYDFVYDDAMEQLRISHRYSHRRRDTQSVRSIISKMIDHAKSYLEEVRHCAQERTDAPEK